MEVCVDSRGNNVSGLTVRYSNLSDVCNKNYTRLASQSANITNISEFFEFFKVDSYPRNAEMWLQKEIDSYERKELSKSIDVLKNPKQSTTLFDNLNPDQMYVAAVVVDTITKWTNVLSSKSTATVDLLCNRIR